jgi:hypothetical protein
MNEVTHKFCQLVRRRSDENRRAMAALATLKQKAISPMMSLLRQELDSMIRAIYLLCVHDPAERTRLIKSTIIGKKWQVRTEKGKLRNVTDREMAELAQKLQGWTKSVYKFGCAFIHLSDFHNYFDKDPFQRLPKSERNDILNHMRYHHGGPLNDNPDIYEFSMYLPQVIDKISGNLKCYLTYLEEGKIIEMKEL